MCLIVFSYQPDSDTPWVILANRDEFYARPSKTAHFWPESPHVLAGRDLVAGGTWLGITKSGRFAAVTNYREGHRAPKNWLSEPLSRGELTANFLRNEISAQDYLETLKNKSHCFQGFNLLLGDQNQLFYFSNRLWPKPSSIQPLSPGLYGLSNQLLDSDWFKVRQAKSQLQHLLDNNAQDKDFLSMFQDQSQAPDTDLPDTGIPYTFEKYLSSIFIKSPSYGTRSTTLIKKRQKNIDFTEVSFSESGIILDNRHYHLIIDIKNHA